MKGGWGFAASIAAILAAYAVSAAGDWKKRHAALLADWPQQRAAFEQRFGGAAPRA